MPWGLIRAMRPGLRILRAAILSSVLPVLVRLTRPPLLGPWLLYPVGVLALAARQPALAEPALAAALSRRRAWTGTIHR